MKQDELKPCSLCGEGVMHDGAVIFYRFTVEVHGVDIKAVQRHTGLEQVFGGGQAGARLANVMGPNDDMTKLIDTEQKTLCMPCALNRDNPIARLLGDG